MSGGQNGGATHDIIVIGAGPAGLSAAIAAAQCGARVALVDEQAGPGGRIYHGAESSAPSSRLAAALGPARRRGAGLIAVARTLPGISWYCGESVWSLEADGSVWLAPVLPVPPTTQVSGAITESERPGPEAGTGDGLPAAAVPLFPASASAGARRLCAPARILAPGARERGWPLPGWTLPGVMMAGAAQVALKGAGLVPEGSCVLAGQGPLLWLLASQLVAMGAPPAALVLTGSGPSPAEFLRALPGALADPGLIATGLALMARVRAAGVPVYRAATAANQTPSPHQAEQAGAPRGTCWQDMAAEAGADGTVARFTFTARNGRRISLDCRTLLLHQGIVPDNRLARALGVPQTWNAMQRCWQPEHDAHGETTVAGVFVAGDSAGISGAAAAALQGRLAGFAAAHRIGLTEAATAARLARPSRCSLRRLLAVRPLVDTLWQPEAAVLRATGSPDTVVCRCEGVTAGEIAAAAQAGCSGLSQLKTFTRLGMGACQGRTCEPAAAEILAAARGVAVETITPLRVRPPLAPLPLGLLGALASDPAVVAGGAPLSAWDAPAASAPPVAAGQRDGG